MSSLDLVYIHIGDSLLKVIDLQEIQGCWTMSKEITKLIGVKEIDISSFKDIKVRLLV